MYKYLAFSLFAFGWMFPTEAGDACAMQQIEFCDCTEHLFNQTTNLVMALAPTTSPRIRDPYKQTIVECDLESTDRTSLELLASSLHRMWVDKLSIKNIPMENENILGILPRMWLKDVRVRQFEISHSKLSGDFIWNGNPFVAQNHNLVWFSAVSCSLYGALTYDTLGTVNIKGLEDLPRLEGIDFSNNYLVSVQKSAFSHAHPKLKTIVLSRNRIQEVMPGAFQTVKNLHHIDLSQNALENISRDIFSNNPKALTHINMSWNKLQSLPKNIFSNMSALKIVDFSKNFLYSLPEEPWKLVLWQLDFIDVTGNFIECDCDLSWLVSNSSEVEGVSKRTVKGECARSLPALLVRHFDLDILTKDKLDCEDDEYGEYVADE